MIHERIALKIAGRFNSIYKAESLREAKRMLNNLVKNDEDKSVVLKQWERIVNDEVPQAGH